VVGIVARPASFADRQGGREKLHLNSNGWIMQVIFPDRNCRVGRYKQPFFCKLDRCHSRDSIRTVVIECQDWWNNNCLNSQP
jgi:hypothetical protein